MVDSNDNMVIERYEMAVSDLCARIDLAVSSLLNIATEMNNAKAHYLKMLGQMGLERKRVAAGNAQTDSNDLTK